MDPLSMKVTFEYELRPVHEPPSESKLPHVRCNVQRGACPVRDNTEPLTSFRGNLVLPSEVLTQKKCKTIAKNTF